LTVIKSVKLNPGGSWVFHCEDRDIFFQRIVGGIAWPGERPGFICIVGEESYFRPPYQLHLLAEAEEQDTSELIRQCRELQAKWRVQDFYARLDETILRYLELTNQQAITHHGKPFQVLAAPFSDGSIAYHVQLLKDRLKPGQKSLQLGSESKLPSAVLELPVDQVFKAIDEQYPAVAALGYAVSALVVWPPLDEDRADTTDDEYDLFGD
jgi:hypothetical protein